jgi:hypothetical protein
MEKLLLAKLTRMLDDKPVSTMTHEESQMTSVLAKYNRVQELKRLLFENQEALRHEVLED